MVVWLCQASRQSVIKCTPAPAGREREEEEGRHAPLLPKCYKTHTGTGGQRERERGKEKR